MFARIFYVWVLTIGCMGDPLAAYSKYEYAIILSTDTSAEACVAGDFSFVRMNNKGQLCGSVHDEGVRKAAAWDSTSGLRIFPDLEGWTSSAIDINDKGNVIGILTSKEKQPKIISFLWNTRTDAVEFGPYDFSPIAINCHNRVVGKAIAQGSSIFTWHSGVFTQTNTIDAKDINDNDVLLDSDFLKKIKTNYHPYKVDFVRINNSGTAIGNMNHMTAVVYANGGVRLLKSPSYPSTTFATSLNNLGQIVGCVKSLPSQSPYGIAVLWEKGDLIDLNTLIEAKGAEVLTVNWASQINDRSQILAYGLIDGKTHVHVLLTPKTALED